MSGECLEKVHFFASPAQLKHIRTLVRNIGQQLQLPTTITEEMVIGVNEACMNIIQHGYRNNPDGEINIEILTSQDGIIFRIMDHAPPVDPSALIPRDLEEVRPGGLGLHFIHSVMDGVAYKASDHTTGNILELRKNIAQKDLP